MHARRGGHPVLRDLSLRVHPGERLAVLGPSGVGKSTLVRVLAGLTAGIELHAERLDVVGFSPDSLARRAPPAGWWGGRVGVALQGAPLDPLRSVANQLSALRRRHGLGAGTEEVIALLQRCGLDDARRLGARFPHQLSGGERTRVGLAFALAGDPVVLLADEPTAGLDPERARAIGPWLRAHCFQQGLALVLVTHDEDLATLVCDRTLRLTRATGPEET